MRNLLPFLLMFATATLAQNPPTAVSPINTVGVATGCTTRTTCTYTDTAVKPGPHFYFIVAAKGAAYSGPSNRVDVTVPSGTHNVVLSWDPGPADVTYFVYRGAPATNLSPTIQ